MSYRPTFAVHAIGRDEPKALEIGIEAMGFLTKALTLIDESHLRRFPTTTPRLYSEDFNALYDPMDPPEGSACGDDDWADLGTILDDESPKGPNGEKLLDCEDAASIRAAEANVIFRVGETAKPITCPCCTGRGWVFPRVEPYVMLHRDWVRDERGERRRRHLYHVVDRWPEGLPRYPNTVERVDGILLEDPSDVLGMGR
jgi:hypothetical protein